MGLREQKKQRVRAAIIENAIALFRERGFDAVRVQDIAGPLELSDATFFNYFPTKDAVLSEWLRDLVETAFCQQLAANSGRARTTCRSAARQLAERIVPEAELLAAAWPRVRQHAAQASPRIRELMAEGQASGDLRSDLPAGQLADVLIAGLLVTLGGWLAEPTAGALPERLRGVVDLVFDGSRKRNERVRPASAATVPRA